MIIPDTPHYVNSFVGFIVINSRGGIPEFASFPTRIYNNTFVNLRLKVNIATDLGGPIIISARSEAGTAVPLAALNITETNNVVHQPNMDTPETRFAPLSTDILFASRNEGLRLTWHQIITVLPSAVPEGGSYSVAYAGASEYLAADSPRHKLIRYGFGELTYTLTFGATEVTVTNNGAKWSAGSTMELQLENAPGHYRPKNPAYASGDILAFAPLEGSAALGAALREPSAERDIIGQFRPVYPSMGAWEMP